MIRKLILSAVVAAGVTMTPATADAAPPVGHGHRHDHDRARYEVLIRHRGHWDTYGVYRDRDDARRVAWRLERVGHDARVEVRRDRR